MVLDAALAVQNREVVFVPISIGYERIVETTTYGRELIGAEKTQEDAAGLLRGAGVLRNRYGRINMQFGKPLSVQSLCDELGLPLTAVTTPAKRRAVLTRLGNRAMDEINRVTAVTPGALVALVLLSDERRSLSHEELIFRCQRLLRVLSELSARVTPRTETEGVLNEETLLESTQMFVDAELIEIHRPGDFPAEQDRRLNRPGVGSMYRVPERKRIEPCKPDVAQRHTGYQVGGTSPFGVRKPLPVYVERSVLAMPFVYINGGRRGFLVRIRIEDLQKAVNAIPVDVARS
jgi:glycerol-3-phosphate O-acyltransferase